MKLNKIELFLFSIVFTLIAYLLGSYLGYIRLTSNSDQPYSYLNRITQDKRYNIFFFETNLQNKYFYLRQLCAIESAAKNNPNARIYVYSLTAKMNQFFLDKYPNIISKKLNIDEFMNGTIIEKWYYDNKKLIYAGPFAIAHLADMLRLVALWRYGGYYSDLDTITAKSIENLLDYPGFGKIYSDNDNDVLSNAIIILPKQHPFLVRVLTDLMTSYQPNSWAHNGPNLIERTLKSYCKIEKLSDNLLFNKYILESTVSNFGGNSSCGVYIYPNNFFFVVSWQTQVNTNLAFKKNQTLSIENFIDVYAIHFYGSGSKSIVIERNSIYEYFAKFNCPLSYEILTKYESKNQMKNENLTINPYVKDNYKGLKLSNGFSDSLYNETDLWEYFENFIKKDLKFKM